MKIAILSDTHGQPLDSVLNALAAVRPGLVIHAGDIMGDHICSEHGELPFGHGEARENQAKAFLRDWNAAADRLDCPIVMVPGNHDFFLAWPPPEPYAPDWDRGPDWNFARGQQPPKVPSGWVPPEIEHELDPRIKILNGSSVRTKGLRLWGSPWTPHFGNWAYNFMPASNGGWADAAKHWAQIPEDTDILITHGPPRGILDDASWGGNPWQKACGCPMLRAELDSGRIKPKLHVFGHIHGACGQLRQGETLFVNAAAGFGREAEGVVVEMG